MNMNEYEEHRAAAAKADADVIARYAKHYDPSKLTPEQLRDRARDARDAETRRADDIRMREEALEAERTGADIPTNLTGPYTSRPEPCELVKASPSLMEHWRGSVFSSEQIERWALSALRLSQDFAGLKWHTDRAAKDPDYWVRLNHSGPNRYFNPK